MHSFLFIERRGNGSCRQAATSLFNAASSENSEEQQAAEDALREAMSSPSRARLAFHLRLGRCMGRLGRLGNQTEPSRKTEHLHAFQISRSALQDGQKKAACACCVAYVSFAVRLGMQGVLCVADASYSGLVFLAACMTLSIASAALHVWH